MTQQEKTFSWIAVLQSVSVMAMFAIITLLGSTVIKTQENVKNIEDLDKAVKSYKADNDDNSKVLHNRCGEIDKKKVDKREMDNLKLYMGAQFHDIKTDIKEIKKILNHGNTN